MVCSLINFTGSVIPSICVPKLNLKNDANNFEIEVIDIQFIHVFTMLPTIFVSYQPFDNKVELYKDREEFKTVSTFSRFLIGFGDLL